MKSLKLDIIESLGFYGYFSRSLLLGPPFPGFSFLIISIFFGCGRLLKGHLFMNAEPQRHCSRLPVPLNRISIFPARFLLLALLTVLVPLFSACSMQSVSVDPVNKASLVETPVFDERMVKEDFSFPGKRPSLLAGRQVYQKSCSSCHAVDFWQKPSVQQDLALTTPIDLYLYLTTGDPPKVIGPSEVRQSRLLKAHPAFRSLARDDRWAVLFYARHLAGAGDLAFKNRKGEDLSVATIFGANCAVCHGKEGNGDGTLHTGHVHKGAPGKVHSGLFQPAPAMFTQYKRLYNRTDAQLVKYIKQGLYPSAMPPWYGLYDKDKDFLFDDYLIWRLVRHVRSFGYTNDLPDGEPVPPGPVPAIDIPVEQAGSYLPRSLSKSHSAAASSALAPADAS
ncbi:MAG: c-type cytochrome [Candidatus Melainabacteria bacterium]|nr:c-type cytochrome [Candidatus Melainabacteria bacterium]